MLGKLERMKKLFIAFLLFASTGFAAGTSNSAPAQSPNSSGKVATPLELSASEDLEIFFRLDEAVKQTSEKIMACVQKGQTPVVCRCQSKSQVEHLQQIFNATLKARPIWKNKDLQAKGKNDLPVFLSLQGLQKELETKTCP